MFNTPILFLIFNRPGQTAVTFDNIRRQQPKYLYIGADGPRASKPTDAGLCRQCKDIVSVIDWDCEVKTLFRDENLGCGAAPASAISWFFDNVNEGIILEDDCVPNDSFFGYCETLLETYRDTPIVKLICGTSYQPEPLNADTYYFSQYPHVWGWATWKRTWDQYNFRLDGETEATRATVIKKTFSNNRERGLWRHNMQLIVNGLDAWDYQLMYWMWKNDGLCVVPWKNMIANIGFGTHGTHTLDAESTQSRMAQYEISLINHPNNIHRNKKADRFERYTILISPAYKHYLGRFRAGIKKIKRMFVKDAR